MGRLNTTVPSSVMPTQLYTPSSSRWTFLKMSMLSLMSCSSDNGAPSFLSQVKEIRSLAAAAPRSIQITARARVKNTTQNTQHYNRCYTHRRCKWTPLWNPLRSLGLRRAQCSKRPRPNYSRCRICLCPPWVVRFCFSLRTRSTAVSCRRRRPICRLCLPTRSTALGLPRGRQNFAPHKNKCRCPTAERYLSRTRRRWTILHCYGSLWKYDRNQKGFLKNFEKKKKKPAVQVRRIVRCEFGPRDGRRRGPVGVTVEPDLFSGQYRHDSGRIQLDGRNGLYFEVCWSWCRASGVFRFANVFSRARGVYTCDPKAW